MARKLTPECFTVLEAALKNPKERMQAVQILLDRGWGKPKEYVEQTNINYDGGGIDAPTRPDTIESAEAWLARRRKELSELH